MPVIRCVSSSISRAPRYSRGSSVSIALLASCITIAACSDDGGSPAGAMSDASGDTSALPIDDAPPISGGGTEDAGMDNGSTDVAPLEDTGSPDGASSMDTSPDTLPPLADAEGEDTPDDTGAEGDADAGVLQPACGKGTLKGPICAPGSMTKVAGARVYVDTIGCDGEPFFLETFTNANGEFTLLNIPKGLQRVDVESPQYTGWFHAQINPGAVTMHTNIEGCGKTTAPNPCATGTLIGNICPPGASSFDSAGYTVWVEAKACSGETVVRSAISAPSGDFKLSQVPTGTHWLHVDLSPAVDPDNSFEVWEVLVKIDAGQITPLGEIGAIGCQGLKPLPSGGNGGSTGGGNGTGTVCTDPKWNLCGEAILDYCIDPTPPFPDCNQDGVPDPCPQCPPVEVVFAIDTSGSMDDELSALCDKIGEMITKLSSADIMADSTVLGIGSTLSCADSTVVDEFGIDIPDAPASWIPLGGGSDCGDTTEDWARAVAVVSANKPWKPNSVRMIVPISDEGPYCGDPTDDKDKHFTDLAIEIAKKYGVIVSPIAGTGSEDTVLDLGKKMALLTGGVFNQTTNPNNDISDLVIYGALDACSTYSDCNQNALPDDCDIANGTLTDANGDTIPDQCQ